MTTTLVLTWPDGQEPVDTVAALDEVLALARVGGRYMSDRAADASISAVERLRANIREGLR